MKKIIILAVFLISGFALNSDAKPLYGDYGFFYSQLSPHGQWLELHSGVVVWQPMNLRRGWAPYRFGQWVWTNHGWYWDSYEPFGYIVYHYGRWYNDDYYGWIWVPDDEWAPSWVEWRYDDDYIGWAPLPPYASFSIHIGIHFSYDYHTPYNHWHFVKYNYMCDPYVYRYYVGSKYKYRVFSKTKYRTDYGYDNGRVFNRGVDVDYIRTRTKQDIRLREIETVKNVRDLDVNRNQVNRNNERIRTYIPSREEITRERTRDVEIKRSERETSLDASRIELGRDRNTIRNNERNTRNNDVPVIRGNDNTRINNDIKEDKNIERQREADRVIRETDRYKKEIPVKEKPITDREISRERVIQKRENVEQKKEVKQERKEVEKRDVPQVRNNNTEQRERTVEKPKTNNNGNSQREIKREERKVEPRNNNTPNRERNTDNSRSTERRR